MLMSSTATSGLSFPAISTASRPFTASAHTCHPGRDSSSVRSPARTTGWSSATRMRSCMEHLSFQRKCGPHSGSRLARFDLQSPSQLRHPFAHANDSDAESSARFVELLARSLGNAAPLIAYLQHDPGRLSVQANASRAAAGMPLNVGQAFLDDPEEGRLSFLGQPAKSGRNSHLHPDAAPLAESLSVFLYCGGQSQLIEQRRMQQVRECADLAGHVLEHVAGVAQYLMASVVERRTALRHLGEAQIDRQHALRQAVVEVASPPAPLFVLKLELACGKLPQRLLRFLLIGDVGERHDNRRELAIGGELGHCVSEHPK